MPTFFDDVDDVISVEAKLICVLGVVGVQRLTLWNLWLGLWLGFGGRFGPTCARRGSVGGRSVCTEEEEEEEEEKMKGRRKMRRRRGNRWVKGSEEEEEEEDKGTDEETEEK